MNLSGSDRSTLKSAKSRLLSTEESSGAGLSKAPPARLAPQFEAFMKTVDHFLLASIKAAREAGGDNQPMVEEEENKGEHHGSNE